MSVFIILGLLILLPITVPTIIWSAILSCNEIPFKSLGTAAGFFFFFFFFDVEGFILYPH